MVDEVVILTIFGKSFTESWRDIGGQDPAEIHEQSQHG